MVNESLTLLQGMYDCPRDGEAFPARAQCFIAAPTLLDSGQCSGRVGLALSDVKHFDYAPGRFGVDGFLDKCARSNKDLHIL